MSDEFIARVLAESGRRTPPLNQAVQANILKAMMVENARLIAAEAKPVVKPQRQSPVQAQPQTSWWDSLLRLFNPPVARGLGGAFAAVLFATLYGLFGGRTGADLGRVSGNATLRTARTGVFNWQWLLASQVGEQPAVLHGGDQLTAQYTTTIVLADNSHIIVSPGSTIAMNADGSGVVQMAGEVAYQITPSIDGKPKFKVESANAAFIVKGTVFRIRREGNTVFHYTDEGRVGAVAGTDAKDVTTGEQVKASEGHLFAVELQTPIVTFDSASGSRTQTISGTYALTNRPSITLTARIFPGATMFATDEATGKTVAQFTADNKGMLHGNLPTTSEGDYRYRFYVVAVDGRKSGQSEPVHLVVDRSAPAFTIEPLSQNGDAIIVRGTTEENVQVMAGDQAMKTGKDGSFEIKVNKTTGLKVVRVVFTDEAGNAVPAYVKVP